ncbi:ATP-dependent protease LonA [Gottschalkia acidurici 9a]|uniref:Lon protease n=1 Tax=Gottschalkia acidurici (strain ATCC 7906 / DSM 604 / BCRC 14475 / CIP 104303 / KCTC 5404 / NCIMB 10678 / 9a) TaxID=1128398 RepID=K0AWM5_GOTA9|nr:endopeptidase La [Gottschalkia acidurici]AFS77639.1 ATP-dependent protease LonA [Gottschalkia acidurici 9a]
MNYKVEFRKMPVIPLRGLSIFPYMVIHFDVGRDKSINALEEAMINDSLVFLTSQKEATIDVPEVGDFYETGTICKIKQMLKLPGDTIRVLVEGINRGKIKEIIEEEPYFEAEIEEFIYDEETEKDRKTEALMRIVVDSFEEYISIGNKISGEILVSVSEIQEPGRLADVIASYIFLTPENKQRILESFHPYERLETLEMILSEETEILKLEEKISERVKKQVNKVQKEYYLREQLKAIQSELGEGEDILSEVEELKEKINKIKMPEEVKEKALKEINRLSKLPPSSSEVGIIRNYLDWIIELPWDKETKDTVDIKKSREVLDKDHYGLKDVKERILEYLAIRKLSNNMKAPIICLVGPPGVGKTSIAKSIATALSRKFVRMSLGGVRDEAEIRGHRRTYVGAIPGRIISSMKKVDSKNPVFLLDEIDKLSGDFRGDPASALLEVLDPEQNNTFTDHFLEAPFDLSKVMFITTANALNTIPGPLLDRMEVIRVSGYTEEEKLQIAIRYLLPKQLEEHGLKEENLQISENTIKDIISKYTREAGVRGLERQIANVCRKAAKRIVEEDINVVRINSSNLQNYLGIYRFSYDTINEENQVGIVTGLAWTSVGGDTLSIEVTPMNGVGKLQLTGKLGDVMKESAMAGISYIRSRAEELGIDVEFYKNKDIHIHVPEGAIPKDGPSAGITMATAVISALSNTPVYKNVAMTGEITLRGRVLPVGGIKEKVLAAHRAGITKILLPWDCKKDMEDVPNKTKKEIEFVFVKNMDEVLEHALVKEDDK